MTIKEIAEMSGVSRATVSRYLNHGYVSQEKADRIRKVIDETGYTPSVSAKLLRSNRTNLIGVIIPKISSDSISRMVSGISEVLTAHGLQMILAVTDNNEKEEIRYLKTFRQNNADGIILFGTILTAEHYEVLREISTPVVILSQQAEGFSCVYSDDYHAASALGALVGRTAAHPAILTVTEKDIAVGQNRLKGLLDGLKRCGRTVEPDCIRESLFSMESGYENAAALLKSHPETDTILCATDTIAAGVLRCLHEQGIRIPEEIQVTGFGDSSFSTAVSPALTTVHFYYEEAGEKTASVLLSQIDAEGAPVIREIQLAYDLVQRASTR